MPPSPRIPALVLLPWRLMSAAVTVTLAAGAALAPDGPVRRRGGYADQLSALLGEGGLLDRLLQDHGLVEKLVADGGTLDQLVALGPILEEVHPRLIDLVTTLPELRASIEVLSESVVPLSDLANRLPGRRRSTVNAS